jgi:hypothetical protein
MPMIKLNKINKLQINGFAYSILFVAGLVFPQNLCAETLYVRIDGTKMMEKEFARSKVVKTLEKDTPVEFIQKNERFYKVSLQDKTEGWIYKFKLTRSIPFETDDNVNEEEFLKNEQIILSRESDSSSSIRANKLVLASQNRTHGLSLISKRHATKTKMPQKHIDSFSEMVNFEFNQEEWDGFLREGRLGEYFP